MTDLNLVHVLRARADAMPDRVIYRYLDDGETESSAVNAEELDASARRIAAALQQRLAPGNRVVMLFPPGLDFARAFWGCLYAGIVAVPVPLPRARGDASGLEAIVRSAKPSALLGPSAILGDLAAAGRSAGAPLIGVEDADAAAPSLWREPSVRGSALAYLQYTSGSTATPKGVMVSHENVLSNLEDIDVAFRHTADSVCVSWLPHYHDMGLVYGILQPVSTGATCVLFPPLKFIQRPLRWLAAITRWRATHSGAPNFAYDLCCRRVSGADLADLDLRTWRVAFNGAEPVRADTVRKFSDTFAPCGFRASAMCPAYGLAEATLKVTARDPDRDAAVHTGAALAGHGSRVPAPVRDVVGCGRVGSSIAVAIVDPETGVPLGDGVVGEIWVRGPGVALGYWDRSEETARVFGARLRGDAAVTFLRTGDLGFMRDGELFVTGRLKDMLIVRGQNHYPEDLEATVEEAADAVRLGGVAAFGVEALEGERVVIAAEVDAGADASALDATAEAIAAAVQARHQFPVHAVALLRRGWIPRTTSGKPKRHECRDRFLKGELKALHVRVAATAAAASAPRLTRAELVACDPGERVTHLRAYVAGVIAAAGRIPPHRLAGEVPLVSLGIDSLAASDACARFAEDLQLEIAPMLLLSGIDAGALAAELDSRLGDARGAAPVPRGEDEPGTYPLSYAQESIWSAYRLDPSNAAYNIARAFRCADPLDVPIFTACVETLVERHAALRTSFALTLAGPMRVVHPRGTVTVAVEDATLWPEDAVTACIRDVAAQPFRLEADPLLRVTLFERGTHRVLVLCAHHIVVDLQSMEMLLEELGNLYRAMSVGGAATPPAPAGSYTAFVEWQRQLVAAPSGEALWRYWEKVLAGDPPVLELPADYPRDAVRSYAGARCMGTISAAVQRRLRALSEAQGTTLYVTLLAAFLLLLQRYSGQRRLWVGSPGAGRHLPELADTVGQFADLLVLTAEIDPRATFLDLMARVRTTVLGAVEHAALPFLLLVQRFAPPRDASRTPLVQALFALHRGRRFTGPDAAPLWAGHSAMVAVGPLRWESIAIDVGASQFDISLVLADAGDGLAATLEFDSRLFARETAERLLAHFGRIAEQVSLDAERPLAEIPMLRDEERTEILHTWNARQTSYERDVLLHELVERQAARTPAACAVLFEDEQLTYAALDARATALAERLRGLGVGPDVRVGVCMHRGIDLPVGLLAILKAGAAYVPIDPSYPDEYVRELLVSSGVAAVIAHGATSDRLRGVTWLDVPSGTVHGPVRPASGAPAGRPAPLDLAYVIYTSGSTGRPKGVMNTHQAICNRLLWMQDVYRLDSSDTVLQKTPLTFDVSVWEVFWPLLAGARLAMSRPGGHRDPAYLLEAIDRYRVTTLHFVPPMLRVFLDAPDLGACRTLRRVICSGEALPVAVAQRFHERLGAELHNLYGPTEAAVDVSSWRCPPGADDGRVPIGHPIANVQLHVLDREMEPVPIGAKGQIFVGGVALARGYVNRPDLTAERFVPDPICGRGGRLYATGDVGRYRRDGAIEFLERVDDQVKIRGFRVELDEVAAAVRRCEGVRDCIVVRAARDGGDVLVAYVVGYPGLGGDVLKRSAAAALPDFMVPAAFVILDAFPLTTSGKIDRRKLPALTKRHDAEYVAPRTPLEADVSRIWAEAFEVARIGVHDNFFELGGHSLLAMEIVTRLNQEFQVNLPIVLLLSGAPDVALVAEALEHELAGRQRELV